jgi:uncharacterized iron-regulated membrane protein
MRFKALRQRVFILHRYLGLVLGVILAMIGITGSLLVFYPDVDKMMIQNQFGPVIANCSGLACDRLPIEKILANVSQAFNDQPGFRPGAIYPHWTAYPDGTAPLNVGMIGPNDRWIDVAVNPYTGAILGTRQWDNSFFDLTLKLHYQLLAGELGTVIVGVIALFMLILIVTGLLLWPGWRRLKAGFSINWRGHLKRVNFDIHKLTGAISGIFLVIIAFTGLCWNFPEVSNAVLYAVTFSPKLVNPTSNQTLNKSPLTWSETLRQQAETALPGGFITVISLPETPDGVFIVYKKFPQDANAWGNSHVYLDQYSGTILRVDSHQTKPLADQITNLFQPLHYGYFGGLSTRLLYVVIGLAPTLLLGTGLVQWWYRYPIKPRLHNDSARSS